MFDRLNKNDTFLVIGIAIMVLLVIIIPFIIFSKFYNKKSKEVRDIYCRKNGDCVRGNITSCNGDIFLSEKDCKINSDVSKV